MTEREMSACPPVSIRPTDMSVRWSTPIGGQTDIRTPDGADTAATHHVTRYADERGYVASCGCGWRVSPHAHELEDTLEIRRS